MSGGGGGGDQTTEMELPPYMTYPAGRLSKGIMGIGQTPFFPGQTYADQSQYTQQGIQGLGQGVNYDPSLDLYQNTIQGDYLGMSPAFSNAVMEPAMENVASRFEQSGRYGSPANQQAMAEAGMRAMAPYYGQERQRQMQAASLFPMLQEQQYRTQLGAGGLEEAWGQKPIEEAMARHYYDPLYNQLQQQSGLLATLPYGQSQTIEGPGSGSSLAGGLGGALTGAGLGGELGLLGAGASSPWGWGLVGAGALAGLLEGR